MSPAYGAGGLIKAVIEGACVLKPFRPLPGQWMRVLGEKNFMVDTHDHFEESFTSGVAIL
jgi:hypothetical protein